MIEEFPPDKDVMKALIMSKTEVIPRRSCWIWKGPMLGRSAKKGIPYPIIWLKKNKGWMKKHEEAPAYLTVYEMIKWVMSDKTWEDRPRFFTHSDYCPRECVNPDHLQQFPDTNTLAQFTRDKYLITREKIQKIVKENIEIDPNTNCWVWAKGWNGYEYGVLIPYKRGPKLLAHRVSLWAFRTTLYDKDSGEMKPCSLDSMKYVVHRFSHCPRACVNPDHLIRFDNRKEMASHVSSLNSPLKGFEHPTAKITPEIMEEILQGMEEGFERYHEICERIQMVYGISITPKVLQSIKDGSRWWNSLDSHTKRRINKIRKKHGNSRPSTKEK